MSRYPDCFPDNFEKDILPKEAREENKEVYRIIKYGTINRESFISTYEEMQEGLIPRRKRMNLNDPGVYSTSCNLQYEEAEYVLKLMMKHCPRAFIAKGITEKSCGPCQLTAERENEHDDTHVDWWIYKDSTPQVYFKEVEAE